jgi:alginate O-acetyltransferase complex protein AlgJ
MRKNKILIFAFALLLTLPVLDNIFHFSPVKDLFEKRLPVPLPSTPKTFAEAQEFTRNFEKFFNDNYGFRKSLITINSRMMDKVFNESPDSRAVIGKEGWLYFDNQNSLLDAAGRAEISDALIERGVKSFGENWQKMRAKNIDYLLVIAADKGTIYPEFLPDYITPKEPHRIDKFLTALRKKYPDFPVIDLRPILLEAKKQEEVYQRVDTHWSKPGAHYAYVEIAKLLKIKPHLRSDFSILADGYVSGDIAQIMNSDVTELNVELVPQFERKSHIYEAPKAAKEQFHKPMFFENSDKNLPVLFAYKDSFFGNLTELVSEHFSQSAYINEFPCDLNYEILKNYRPNVVIQEFWEGRIEVVLSQCKQ